MNVCGLIAPGFNTISIMIVIIDGGGVFTAAQSTHHLKIIRKHLRHVGVYESIKFNLIDEQSDTSSLLRVVISSKGSHISNQRDHEHELR